jgi:hypothetical protein
MLIKLKKTNLHSQVQCYYMLMRKKTSRYDPHFIAYSKFKQPETESSFALHPYL